MEAKPTPAAAPGSGAMFDAIAPRYDLLNRILSAGIDARWRRLAVASLHLGGDPRVLDLATGTADMALLVASAHEAATVVGLDPSNGMLAIGRARVERAGCGTRVTLEQGDAEQLPFPDASFDACCMAFGIRNVPDRPRALREVARVVKPGGRVAILELSEPRGAVLGRLVRFHIHTVVPRVGALLSGAPEYRYLEESIARFPPPAAFAQLMTEAGLSEVTARPLTFGACCLFTGRGGVRPA